MYIRFPLSLRQVEDLLDERGIDICHESVRVWWNRFGPTFAAEIRKKRSASMRANTQWRWHLDEVFVRINGDWRSLLNSGGHTFIIQLKGLELLLEGRSLNSYSGI